MFMENIPARAWALPAVRAAGEIFGLAAHFTKTFKQHVAIS